MLLLFSLYYSPSFHYKKEMLAQNIYKEESVVNLRFYLGFYFTLPKRFKSITPATINTKPIVPYRFGI